MRRTTECTMFLILLLLLTSISAPGRTRQTYAEDNAKPTAAPGIPILTVTSVALPFAPDPARNAIFPAEVFPASTGETTRVSIATNGAQGNGGSDRPAISADGRFVAFQSEATNLVEGDTNGVRDIFVHDRQTGQTTRVSAASDGTQGNGHSYNPAISADGRFVAFYSSATNLVAGDTHLCDGFWGTFNCSDVFVHDRQTGQTTRVSVASDGTQSNGHSYDPAISADGRFVAFASSASNLVSGDTHACLGGWPPIVSCSDIFVHDRQTGQTTRVSVATTGAQSDNHSYRPAISADGRFVAFASYAKTLVVGDTNNIWDVFVHDQQTGQTTRVSIASDGTQGNRASGTNAAPAISADGRFIAFESEATNLVVGDTNNTWDVFVHDRQTGQTTRVSVASDGTQGNLSSGAFTALAISADGRFVAFGSMASNLVAGDTNEWDDIFVHDRQTGQTTRVSVATSGTQGNRRSFRPAISANGRFVAFASDATNLVAEDTNEVADVFVYDQRLAWPIYLPLTVR